MGGKRPNIGDNWGAIGPERPNWTEYSSSLDTPEIREKFQNLATF